MGNKVGIDVETEGWTDWTSKLQGRRWGCGVAGYVLSGGNYIGDFPSAGFHWLKSIQTNTYEYLYDIKTHRKVPSFSKLPGERQKLRSFWVMVNWSLQSGLVGWPLSRFQDLLMLVSHFVCLDTWEVFEEISELQWLGSGLQELSSWASSERRRWPSRKWENRMRRLSSIWGSWSTSTSSLSSRSLRLFFF